MGKLGPSRMDAKISEVRTRRHNDKVRTSHRAALAKLPEGWTTCEIRGRVVQGSQPLRPRRMERADERRARLNERERQAKIDELRKMMTTRTKP